MGPGGDGGPRDVRVVDGFGGMPPQSEQPPVPAQDQPVAQEQRPAANPTGAVIGKFGLVNDGFGSFQPTPPEPPSKDKVFFAAIRWFTDGIIETVRETFSLLGLFKPVETFEVSAITYYGNEEITAVDDGLVLDEEVIADDVADAWETSGTETFMPGVFSTGVFEAVPVW